MSRRPTKSLLPRACVWPVSLSGLWSCLARSEKKMTLRSKTVPFSHLKRETPQA